MMNNENNENKKWIPYFKRKDSIYQKHPILAWSTTILVIVVGLCLLYNSYKDIANSAAYNAGYKSVYQK